MNKTNGLHVKLLASALLMLALSGCASMNKAECLNVDWRTVGYEDGVAGRSGDRIGEHRRACAKHGVTPDLNAYQSGRDQGMREYCQPETGYQLGVNGYALKSYCPVELKEEFESAYHAGYELYAMRARVANAQNELDSAHREIAQIDQNLIASSALVLARDTDNVSWAQAGPAGREEHGAAQGTAGRPGYPSLKEWSTSPSANWITSSLPTVVPARVNTLPGRRQVGRPGGLRTRQEGPRPGCTTRGIAAS